MEMESYLVTIYTGFRAWEIVPTMDGQMELEIEARVLQEVYIDIHIHNT